ncbi:MAG: undecaprenyldiphospho-muramoylpentapeptide beta-N-acetylglucosaminyltransferase [Bacteroidota bacterium]
MSKKFIIAGGGTGGHIFPAIAIANALKQQLPDAEFLFIGAKGKMEMEKVPQAGFKIEGLDIAGFNRSSLIKNIGLPYKLITSFFQVRRIFNRFKPDAVIGVGGYSSYPVLRTAQARGISTFIHESNAFAGKANIMLGRKATKVFVATGGMEKFFSIGKIIISGNPVRKAITDMKAGRTEALRFFGLNADKITVLSIGGSLGANSINQAVEAGLDQLAENNLQLIWQTGKPFAEQGKKAGSGKKDVWVNEFIKEMEMAYAAADIVISRAGAMSVAELCVAGKPTIFIPYPFAAEDHQTYNAKVLADKNAAMMIKDESAKSILIETVIGLSKNEALKKVLSENISKEAIRNADELIAKEIIKVM